MEKHNWNKEILPDHCIHFEPSKKILQVANIENFNHTNPTGQITIKAGFVSIKIPIFESKFDNSYYCILQGQKKDKNGKIHYNLTFENDNLSEKEKKESIKRIKSSLVDIYLIYINQIKAGNILDEEYMIRLPNFIISAESIFSFEVPF